MSTNRKGFTLVELVVVVCVLILMMTVLLPGVNKSREQAMAAVCMQNQKSLVMGWSMFAQDHDGAMVTGHNYTGWGNSEDRWVWAPGYRTDDYWVNTASNPTHEERLNGIREGKLYEYVDNVKAYHCPADMRWKENIAPYQTYLTYSITGAMNGEDRYGQTNGSCAYTKVSQVKQPKETYVFVEEIVKNQTYQSGSWLIYTGWDGSKRVPENAGWVDPLGILHDKQSTLGFADGHVEIHTWVDDFTFTFSAAGNASWPFNGSPQQVCNKGNAGGYPSTDFSFLYRGYGGIK